MGEYDTTPIVSMNATLFYVYLLKPPANKPTVPTNKLKATKYNTTR